MRELHEADARATILVARLGSARPPRRLRSLALTGEDSVLGMDIDGSGVAVAVAVDLPTEPGFTALYLARPGGRCGRSRPGAAARRTAS